MPGAMFGQSAKVYPPFNECLRYALHHVTSVLGLSQRMQGDYLPSIPPQKGAEDHI